MYLNIHPSGTVRFIQSEPLLTLPAIRYLPSPPPPSNEQICGLSCKCTSGGNAEITPWCDQAWIRSFEQPKQMLSSSCLVEELSCSSVQVLFVLFFIPWCSKCFQWVISQDCRQVSLSSLTAVIHTKVGSAVRTSKRSHCLDDKICWF